MINYLYDPQFISSESAAIHGFFGREGGVSPGLYASLNCGYGSADAPDRVRENRQIVRREMNLRRYTPLLTLHQVHSNLCVNVDKPWNRTNAPEADAMITDQCDLALGILTADCAPVLFTGEKNNGSLVIGAAHAGWKGALNGILENTLAMMRECGVRPTSLRACIGPCIGPESYEVDNAFRQKFEEAAEDNHVFFTERGNRYFFDLPGFCEKKLQDCGVPHIFRKTIDTFFNEADFFSYRRATHRTDSDYGRQISVIGLR